MKTFITDKILKDNGFKMVGEIANIEISLNENNSTRELRGENYSHTDNTIKINYSFNGHRLTAWRDGVKVFLATIFYVDELNSAYKLMGLKIEIKQ